MTLYFLIPLFFENDLQGSNYKRNVALHSKQLTLVCLINSIKELLKPDCSFALLVPYHRSLHFEELAQIRGFHLNEKVSVKQTEKHPFFRTMLLFSTNKNLLEHEEITIKNNETYSPEFVELLKDYYLYL